MTADRQPGSRGRGESLASSTADQVRSIIEAAETSAAEIQRQATAHVAASLESMLERLDVMRAELSALIEGLPQAGEREVAAAEEVDDFAGGGYATGETTTVSEPDTDGARLIALNMALNGTSREETERYLAENFSSLMDRAGLLDEVYSSIQG
jgi:hypothetical protein